MKDKLIYRWEELNEDRFRAGNEYIYPIMREMNRIALILVTRYNFIVSF